MDTPPQKGPNKMDTPPEKGPDKETIEQDVRDDEVHVEICENIEGTDGDDFLNRRGSDEESDDTGNQLESAEGGKDSKSDYVPEKQRENPEDPARRKGEGIQKDDAATGKQPDSQDPALLSSTQQEQPEITADPGRPEEPKIPAGFIGQEDPNSPADAMHQNPEKHTEETTSDRDKDLSGDKELREGVIRFTDKQGSIESDVDVIDEDLEVENDEGKEMDDKGLQKVLETKVEPARRVSINTNGNIVKLMNKWDVEGKLNNGQTVDRSRQVTNSERYVKNGGFKPRYSNGDVVLEVPTATPDGRRSGRSSPVIIHEIHDVSKILFQFFFSIILIILKRSNSNLSLLHSINNSTQNFKFKVTC